jgi:hypothetical protein
MTNRPIVRLTVAQVVVRLFDLDNVAFENHEATQRALIMPTRKDNP